MEELIRNEELENAITAGAVTVRRRNFVRQEKCDIVLVVVLSFIV